MFLGLVGFYSRLCPDLATIAEPLYALTPKNVQFDWQDIHEQSFRKIRKELVSDRILVHYNPKLPVILSVGASPTGLGAFLAHEINGQEKPIAFASRVLTQSERNYSQIDKEALAIVWGIKKFYVYLYGRRSTFSTHFWTKKEATDFNSYKIITLRSSITAFSI